MIVKIGCDLIHIQKFKKSVEKGGYEFLERIFSFHELAGSSSESLCGILAAKEAAIKALGLKAGEWQRLEVVKGQEGKPEIKISDFQGRIASQDLSISHDGEYAMAAAVFLIHPS